MKTENRLNIGLVFLSCLCFLFVSKCHAQTATIPALYYNTETGQYAFAEDTAGLIVKRYDTIQVWLQYRLPSGQSGIVKGWEIKERDNILFKSLDDPKIIDGKDWIRQYLVSNGRLVYLRSDRRRFPKGTLIWKLQEPVRQ